MAGLPRPALAVDPSGAVAAERLDAGSRELELLIFQLRLDSIILSSDLLAYAAGGRVLLPLGQLAQILEIALDVDPASGRATGQLPDGRALTLDARQREILLGRERQALPAEAIDAQPDDLFVGSELLSRWLPVDFEINRAALVIHLRPREELPVQARLAREKRRQALARSGATPEPLPRFEQPARAWSVPFVDISTEFGYGRLPGAPADGTARFSALAAGDLLYMDATAFVAGSDQNPLSSARFSLGRKDPDGRLLGPLGATEFAIGDILAPQLGLIARSRPERGAVVSNFPLERASEFDETTLIGDLPLGWEVELYRGNVLLDFRTADADGRFAFEDVPLLFGLNLFRLVYYGPQGQQREETRRIFVGPGLIADGEHYYRAAVSQTGTSLFGLDDIDSGEIPEGEGRYSFEYATAIGGVTLQSSLVSLPTEEERRSYVSAGASAALGPVFGGLNAIADDHGGWAAQALAQTQLFGVNLLAEETVFSDFISERERIRLKNRLRLRLDGALTVTPLPPLSYSLDLRHELRASGESSIEASGRVSTRIGRVSLSNSLAYTRRTNLLVTDFGDEEFSADRELRGALLVSGRTGPVFLRGGVDYELAPTVSVGAMALSAEWAIDQDFSTRLTLSHDWSGESGSGVALDVSRRFETVSLGAYAAARTDGELRVGISASLALGQEPRTRNWNVSPQAIAQYGAVSANVFLDRNLNGAFDAGDEALEGVEIRVEGTGKRVKTDADGIAFVTGIPAYTRSRIVLVPGTLEDPFMVPQREGVEAVLRPAERAVVDFPVVMTGEIDGIVQLRRNGQTMPGRNLTVQLLDPAGNMVKKTQSGFDGFYLFDRLRPGRYRVRISLPESGAEIVREAVIGPEGTVVNGLDLILSDAGRD